MSNKNPPSIYISSFLVSQFWSWARCIQPVLLTFCRMILAFHKSAQCISRSISVFLPLSRPNVWEKRMNESEHTHIVCMHDAVVNGYIAIFCCGALTRLNERFIFTRMCVCVCAARTHNKWVLTVKLPRNKSSAEPPYNFVVIIKCKIIQIYPHFMNTLTAKDAIKLSIYAQGRVCVCSMWCAHTLNDTSITLIDLIFHTNQLTWQCA